LKDRTRLYDLIGLMMVVLSASTLTLVIILALARLAQAGSAAAPPTPVIFPSQTPTLAGPTPADTLTSSAPVTRIPLPIWTPLPTDTTSPRDTPEPLAPRPTLPADLSSDPPLQLITSIPSVRDVPEVALEVDLHTAEQWALVQETVHLRNTSSDAWSEVVFSIPINALPDSFALESAAVSNQAVTARLDGIMLHVPLRAPLPPGLPAQITLRYRAAVSGVSAQAGFPAGNDGLSNNVMRLGAWYPAIAPYQPGRGWQTWSYQPVGDPTIYPAANTTLAVQAPPDVTIVSGGFVAHEGNVWRFRVEGARDTPILASSQYRMFEGALGGVTLRCFTLGDNSLAANGALDIARNALSLYSELYGPYPFKSLDIVENGYEGDMEYSALVSISDRGFATVNGQPPLILDTLLAHEIAHQWWYGSVGNDQINEPWLDEGLASYSEALYYDRYFDYSANPRLAAFRAQNLGVPIDLTIYDYPTTTQYKQALYPRAALFLDDLRHLVGDEVFFAFLKDYHSRFAGRLATTADFFAVLRDHTQADLKPLLNTYFANPNR
jgi:hypothetical protein